MTQTRIDSNSRIWINFPIYYSTGLTNFQDLLFCKVNSIPITCVPDTDAPFRLRISNSPINIPVGEEFDLTVFGITTPNKEARDSTDNQGETLFLGVDQGPTYNYYSEFIHLTPPQVYAL
jgi:hypothetical protein